MRSQHLLMGRLFETEDLQHIENGISVLIRLNSGDEVFRGHFPDHPVLPGVCTVQIIKELLSEATGRELRLNKASNIKFLAFVDPFENERIRVDMQYTSDGPESLICRAKMSAGAVTFCNFKGEFV